MEAKEYPRMRNLTAQLTEQDYRLIKAHIAAKGAKIQDWLREAALEKIRRENGNG